MTASDRLISAARGRFWGSAVPGPLRDESPARAARPNSAGRTRLTRLGPGLSKCNNQRLCPGLRADGFGVFKVKLRVDDITAEARELEFPEPEGEINRALGLGAVRDYRLEGPVKVKLAHYRAGTELFIQGEISATARGLCARCAEDFVAPHVRGFRYVLAPRSLGDDGPAATRAEDLEFSTYGGDEVDLAPLIQEQALLAYSTRPLCREDCRGLCPRCGANLNEGDCACPAESGDPRLAVLHTLKLRRPH